MKATLIQYNSQALSTICNAARKSASDKLTSEASLTNKDYKLIRDLMFEEHGVPFEHVSYLFDIEAPLFVVAQLVKHRHTSISSLSKRYRGGVAEFYTPSKEDCTIKGVQILDQDDLEIYNSVLLELGKLREGMLNRAIERIEQYRKMGLIPEDSKDGRDPWRARARELVRGLQPVSEYTKLTMTINFRSLMNFLFLRRSPHAQVEMRMLADLIYSEVKKVHPYLIELFDTYAEMRERVQAELSKSEPVEPVPQPMKDDKPFSSLEEAFNAFSRSLGIISSASTAKVKPTGNSVSEPAIKLDANSESKQAQKILEELLGNLAKW